MNWPGMQFRERSGTPTQELRLAMRTKCVLKLASDLGQMTVMATKQFHRAYGRAWLLVLGILANTSLAVAYEWRPDSLSERMAKSELVIVGRPLQAGKRQRFRRFPDRAGAEGHFAR
jgi:hypothetical protein